jgi:DNA-binding NarL/FixJ family response regulator
VQLARDLEPHVVVMDVNLPGMSGIAATEQLTSERPQVRVVGLSSYATEEVGQVMRQAGAALYLPKNGPVEQLLDGIRSVGRSP